MEIAPADFAVKERILNFVVLDRSSWQVLFGIQGGAGTTLHSECSI